MFVTESSIKLLLKNHPRTDDVQESRYTVSISDSQPVVHVSSVVRELKQFCTKLHGIGKLRRVIYIITGGILAVNTYAT